MLPWTIPSKLLFGLRILRRIFVVRRVICALAVGLGDAGEPATVTLSRVGLAHVGRPVQVGPDCALHADLLDDAHRSEPLPFGRSLLGVLRQELLMLLQVVGVGRVLGVLEEAVRARAPCALPFGRRGPARFSA